MKRERLIEAEIDEQNDMVALSLLEKGFREVNELYGTDIHVELNPILIREIADQFETNVTTDEPVEETTATVEEESQEPEEVTEDAVTEEEPETQEVEEESVTDVIEEMEEVVDEVIDTIIDDKEVSDVEEESENSGQMEQDDSE